MTDLRKYTNEAYQRIAREIVNENKEPADNDGGGGFIQNKNVYIAASFPRQREAQTLAARISAIPIWTVTAGWLHDKDGYHKDAHTLRSRCQRDREQIEGADLVIIFIGDGESHGGRHAEFGYALALRKQIILLGVKPEHILHYAPEVMFTTLSNLAEIMGEL